jgi:hypothetical protein
MCRQYATQRYIGTIPALLDPSIPLLSKLGLL